MGRKERVESALREQLAEMITREVKDQRVQSAGIIGISRVEMSGDLSLARVWVSVYADESVAEKAIAGLQAAAGFLRGPLARRLHLSRPPELRFLRDNTAEVSLRLREIVQEDEIRAKSVGRIAGQTELTPSPEPVDTGAAVDPNADVSPQRGE